MLPAPSYGNDASQDRVQITMPKIAVSKKKRTRTPASPKPSRRGNSQTMERRKKDAETGGRDPKRPLRLLETLCSMFPEADCALQHGSALELLTATILSAQCTDERVNKVTPGLFARYRTAADFANADPAELEAAIRSTGFFRNKTKNLIGMGKRIVERFGGKVPDSMEDLLTLPGVARKTANCVLGTWFRKNEGIVVDTHVGRLALRLGLLKDARDAKDAVKIEQDLVPLFPRESWTFLSHALILHGRATCIARKPRCNACKLAKDCPRIGVTEFAPGEAAE